MHYLPCSPGEPGATAATLATLAENGLAEQARAVLLKNPGREEAVFEVLLWLGAVAVSCSPALAACAALLEAAVTHSSTSAHALPPRASSHTPCSDARAALRAACGSGRGWCRARGQGQRTSLRAVGAGSGRAPQPRRSPPEQPWLAEAGLQPSALTLASERGARAARR